MCGIAGIVSQKTKLVQEARLAAAAQALVHRGPEGKGLYHQPGSNIALAHQRLSIIDLSPAAAAVFITATSFAAEPNQKVLKAFEKTFHDVKDVNWQDVDGQFEANFNHNNIINRVLYDAEGNVVKSIRYYKGAQLPIIIQAKLAKKFEGKTVFGVTELNSANDLHYYIILEDAGTWTHVQSDVYGNITVDKKLKKA